MASTKPGSLPASTVPIRPAVVPATTNRTPSRPGRDPHQRGVPPGAGRPAPESRARPESGRAKFR